jgi:hypothetical protein
VRRVPGIILVFALMAVSSGLIEHIHRLEHSASRSESLSSSAGWQAPGQPGHDEQNCDICLTLHMPLLSAGYIPILICLGVWVAFLSSLRPRLIPQRVQRSIDCRGPPVL